MLSTFVKATGGELEYVVDIQRFSSAGFTYNYSNLGGVFSGDYVYFFLAVASLGLFDPETPSGYTSLTATESELSNRLVYREIDGSEGASVTLSGTSTGQNMSVVAVKVSNQLGFTSGTSVSNTFNSLAVTSITATEGLLFLLGTARDRDSPYTLAYNSTQAEGMTFISKMDTDGTESSMLGIAFVEEVASGSTGTRALDLVNRGDDDSQAGVLLNVY
jgi:hypothetical protein